MSSAPVAFQRDFSNDLPIHATKTGKGIGEKCQRVAVAILPLLSLHKILRGPISLGMSCVRTVTHFSLTMYHVQTGEFKEAAFNLFHTTLAVISVGLCIFNPVLGFLTASISDLVINAKNLVACIQKRDIVEALECLAWMALDLIFIGSFCVGSVKMTIACIIMQMAFDIYIAACQLKKGNYLEGVCQAVLAGGRFALQIPQMKVINWQQLFTHPKPLQPGVVFPS